MHEVFYCGPESERRFAQYHAPEGADRRELVVLCPPVFSEYMRTYGALRELALALASRGMHVVRFDYRGTGDSARDLTEVSLAQWVEDIIAVTHEAKEIADCTRVSAVGVRLGALLALEAQRAGALFERIVTWDPVLDGRAYLGELQRLDLLLEREATVGAAGSPGARGPALAGYLVGPSFVPELAAIRVSLADGPAGRTRVVTTGVTASDGLNALGAAMITTVPFDCRWGITSEDLMSPTPVLAAILDALAPPAA